MRRSLWPFIRSKSPLPSGWKLVGEHCLLVSQPALHMTWPRLVPASGPPSPSEVDTCPQGPGWEGLTQTRHVPTQAKKSIPLQMGGRGETGPDADGHTLPAPHPTSQQELQCTRRPQGQREGKCKHVYCPSAQTPSTHRFSRLMAFAPGCPCLLQATRDRTCVGCTAFV